jgi:plasmid maintenance system antidote protein VapI
MTLADFLRQTKLSQAEFARRVGVDRFRINKVLRGAMRPPLDLAFRIERESGGLVRAESWVGKKVRR